MKPLIVFDLDGTLVDSARDLAESANEMLAAYGAAPLAVQTVASMVGDGARQLVERALETAGLRVDASAALDCFLSVYARRLFVHTRPYDGISDTLARLANRATLAVLTNKPEGLSRQILEHFGWSGRFGYLVGGDSPFPRKPEPAGLRYLMATAAAAPQATMMVGDSMIDVETARRAGAAVCVARYGFGHLRRPLELRAAEVVVDRPQDLGDALERFVTAMSPER